MFQDEARVPTSDSPSRSCDGGEVVALDDDSDRYSHLVGQLGAPNADRSRGGTSLSFRPPSVLRLDQRSSVFASRRWLHGSGALRDEELLDADAHRPCVST
jgi:hypothetical protein